MDLFNRKTVFNLFIAGLFLLLTMAMLIEENYESVLMENPEKDAAISSLEAELADSQSTAAALESELAEAEEQNAYLEEELQEAQYMEESGVVQSLEPGDVLDGVSSSDDVSAYFTSETISVGDSVYNRIYGKSYRENDNISLDDLRYLTLLHYNFNHEVQVGEMIVHKNIADTVTAIFEELFYAEYEIQSIYLIDNYWTGDADSTDTASIEENNTSCFNYREVTGGGSLSKHAYGCAIDINPQQNPYVWYDSAGNLNWTHSNANDYIDRTTGLPHMIVAGDICCSTFEKYGFSWGGYWSNPIDYQHFEIVAY